MTSAWKALLLVALISLAAFATADPLVDLSRTSVGVSEQDNSPTTSTFTVAVQRVDDLLSDDGVFLAERVMSVTMNFDVDDDKILVNNVPVALGVSTIQVEAAIFVGPSLTPSPETLEALEKSFYTGLVTVEVAVTAEIIAPPGGNSFRRVLIRERVIEINGQTVVQTEIGQQAIDVLEDGRTIKHNGEPPLPEHVGPFRNPGAIIDPAITKAIHGAPLDLDGETKSTHHRPCRFRHAHLFSRFSRWWNNQPLAARVAVSSVIGASIFCFAFVVVPSLFRAIFKRKEDYEPVEQEDIKVIQVDIVEIVDEEKRGLMAKQ